MRSFTVHVKQKHFDDSKRFRYLTLTYTHVSYISIYKYTPVIVYQIFDAKSELYYAFLHFKMKNME